MSVDVCTDPVNCNIVLVRKVVVDAYSLLAAVGLFLLLLVLLLPAPASSGEEIESLKSRWVKRLRVQPIEVHVLAHNSSQIPLQLSPPPLFLLLFSSLTVTLSKDNEVTLQLHKALNLLPNHNIVEETCRRRSLSCKSHLKGVRIHACPSGLASLTRIFNRSSTISPTSVAWKHCLPSIGAFLNPQNRSHLSVLEAGGWLVVCSTLRTTRITSRNNKIVVKRSRTPNLSY